MSLLLLLSRAAVGGSVYTDAFLSSVAASDGVASSASVKGSLTESLGLTDALVVKQVFSASLGDGVSLADSYVGKGSFSAVISEQLALSDSAEGKAAFSAALYEQLALADSYALGGAIYTDAMTSQVTLSDGATVRTILAASLGEAIAVSDSLGATQIQVSSVGAALVLAASFDGVRVGLTWPAPADVLLGVQYGPTGSDYTGAASTPGFASRMFVTTTVESLTLTQKPRRQAQQIVEQDVKQGNQNSKNAYVHTCIPQYRVLTLPDEAWVRTNKETI